MTVIVPTRECIYCGAAIVWIVPYGGTRMPVDAEGPYRGHGHARRCPGKRIVVLRRRGSASKRTRERVSNAAPTKGKSSQFLRQRRIHVEVLQEFAAHGQTAATEPVACGPGITLPSEVAA